MNQLKSIFDFHKTYQNYILLKLYITENITDITENITDILGIKSEPLLKTTNFAI